MGGDEQRARARSSSIGGHDPTNKIIHSGWLCKRAVSGTILRTWKQRYIIIRKDRIEYHRVVPHRKDVPRGVLALDEKTRVDAAPQKIARQYTIRVSREGEELYLSSFGLPPRPHGTPSGQAEIDAWFGIIQNTLATGQAGAAANAPRPGEDEGAFLLRESVTGDAVRAAAEEEGKPSSAQNVFSLTIRREPGMLGVDFELFDSSGKALRQLKNCGTQITAVDPEGRAARAGLRTGDVILRVWDGTTRGGKAVHSGEEIVAFLQATPGDVAFSIERPVP
jgi:hypothetical protein